MKNLFISICILFSLYVHGTNPNLYVHGTGPEGQPTLQKRQSTTPVQQPTTPPHSNANTRKGVDEQSHNGESNDERAPSVDEILNNQEKGNLSFIKTLSDDEFKMLSRAYANLPDIKKLALHEKFRKGDFSNEDARIVKYFWNPVSKTSEMIKCSAVLGTVVIPSASMFFHGNDKVSQMLSCACGVATLIFNGISGYSGKKVDINADFQLCLTAAETYYHKYIKPEA